MDCSIVAVQSVSRARGVFVYYMMYMYISADVYCTRELTRCESTVASLLCLAKPKVSHKYILPVAFSLGGSIAASAQLKERVFVTPLTITPPPPGYAPALCGDVVESQQPL